MNRKQLAVSHVHVFSRPDCSHPGSNAQPKDERSRVERVHAVTCRRLDASSSLRCCVKASDRRQMVCRQPLQWLASPNREKGGHSARHATIHDAPPSSCIGRPAQLSTPLRFRRRRLSPVMLSWPELIRTRNSRRHRRTVFKGNSVTLCIDTVCRLVSDARPPPPRGVWVSSVQRGMGNVAKADDTPTKTYWLSFHECRFHNAEGGVTGWRVITTSSLLSLSIIIMHSHSPQGRVSTSLGNFCAANLIVLQCN